MCVSFILVLRTRGRAFRGPARTSYFEIGLSRKRWMIGQQHHRIEPYFVLSFFRVIDMQPGLRVPSVDPMLTHTVARGNNKYLSIS